MQFRGKTDKASIIMAQAKTGLMAYVDDTDKKIVNFFSYSAPSADGRIREPKKWNTNH